MPVQHRIPSEIKHGIAKSPAGPSALWKAAMLGMFVLVPFGSSLFGLLVLIFERPIAWFKRGLHSKAMEQPSMVTMTVWFFLALLAVATVGSFFAQQPGNALLNTIGVSFALCLLISGGGQFSRSEDFLMGVCLPVLTYAGLVSSILNMARFYYYHMDRAYNIIPQHPNATGTLIIFTGGLSLAYLLSRKGWRRYFTLPYLLIIGGSLMLTKSRGALVGFGAMLTVMALYKRKLVAILLILAVLAGLFLAVAPGFRERLQNNLTFITRVQIWQETIRMIKDHPVFGVGAGQFRDQFKSYMSSPDGTIVFAHNLFLQVAAEFGLAGLLVFCAIIALILAMGFMLAKTSNIVYQGLFATIVGILVHMQFDNTIWGLDIGGAFWLMIGMIMGFYRYEYGKKSAHSNVLGKGRGDEGRARRFEAELR